MLKLKNIAAALLVSVALLVPAVALAFPPSGPPVTMTGKGLAEWQSSLKADAEIAADLRAVIADCDCVSREDRIKEGIGYFNEMFHFNGYDYGNTVREYLRAYFRQGKYQGLDREAMEQSGILTYVSPALKMLDSTRGRGWLIQHWVMTEDAVAESKALLGAN